MADPRFFDNHGPFTLARLADLSGATLAEEADAKRLIRDIGPLESAGADELSFLDNAAYIDAFRTSAAGACVVAARRRSQAPEGMALLLSERPYEAYAKIAQAFYPLPEIRCGLDPSASVAGDADIGEGCELRANVVVGARAEIGRRCLLDANVVVGPGAVIGDDCRLHSGVVVSHSIIGDRVVLLPGAKVGQDGFGFAINPAGHVRVPQVGRVRIGDDCVIGANTTIDRGHVRDTVIGPGCWIDNLVQIGHNVVLGSGCIVVAQAGISGSAKLGNLVALGGQAGIAGHLRIGDGAQIAAQSGVINDVPEGAKVAGAPARAAKEFFRQVAVLRRLARHRGSEQ